LQNDKHKKIGLDKGIHDMFNVPDDCILKPEDVASMLRVHTETVRVWCRKGKLDAYTFGGQYAIVGSSFKEFMRKSRNLNNILEEMSS
jgi:excisionase family DNA binding protein